MASSGSKTKEHADGMSRKTYDQGLNVQGHISSLYGNMETSDLSLKVASEIFYVHKTVLCQSPVFHSMLFGSGWHESNAKEIIMHEVEDYIPYFSEFLKYIYGKSLLITWANVEALVYFGDKYALDSLLHECLDFFYDCVKASGNLMCAVNGWKMVRRILTQRQECLTVLQSIIMSNIEMVMLDDDLICLLDDDDVRIILSSDAAVCRTEFTLYRLLEAWLLVRTTPENRLEYLQSLSPLIRISYMRLEEMSYVERSPMRLFPNQNRDDLKVTSTLFKLLLCEGYKYHAVGKVEWARDSTTPTSRLYLSGNSCMQYRLLKTDGLNTWSKVDNYFEVTGSLSKADETKPGMGFCVTLMRKINIQSKAGSDKQRLSLLSLEISPTFAGLIPFKSGLVYILENRSGCILRRPLMEFDIADASPKLDIKLDDVSFEEVVLKNSTYQFDNIEGERVYLALDIFLVE